MSDTPFAYIVFAAVVLLALVFDMGLLSKKNTIVSAKAALLQTIFWVLLAFAFGGFIWFEKGSGYATSYISAYLLEWSLSTDNIFVFILLFSFFKIKEHNYSRVLLLGILMAIVFRILFIAAGSELVARFDWIPYIFGGFLVVTGVRMFSSRKEFDPEGNWAFKFIQKFVRTTNEEPNGRFVIVQQNKAFLTRLAIAVVMLGLIDIVFALDSIPAVFSIIPDTSKKLLIYSSNIFAVLGLRSLFFLLRGASDKFTFLQQGIAVVLLLIGVKMLVTKWVSVPIWFSLLAIVLCIGVSIVCSICHQRKMA